jgi:RNA-directed DNA polymerase
VELAPRRFFGAPGRANSLGGESPLHTRQREVLAEQQGCPPRGGIRRKLKAKRWPDEHFSNNKEPKRRIAPKALLRCKQKIRELTRRTRGISREQMTKELAAYLGGWKAYFGYCQTPSLLKALDEWIRRRLRSMIRKQWKRGTTRFQQLRHCGVSRNLAATTAGSAHGPWRLANSPALSAALPIAYFDSLGLPRLFDGRA